ncbi:MAG: linear amide C-N hydrolase, partial [Clostridia bacterium]|nr:linear amide C-N hydrolase [Clostridia bacterium]
MCTAITYKTDDFYFGRTLDYEFSYGERVTIAPRNFFLNFKNGETIKSHYAILGMAHVSENYPLFYDGINEKGLAMAGLNFPQNAHYNEELDEKNNIASFELILYILSK